jgi:phenylacetate-CoA ligase
MNEAQLVDCRRVPSLLRSLVASAHGFCLRRWWYGPETETLVQGALEREHWSATQWEQWRCERLRFILRRAATQVPYYRKAWEKRREHGDDASWEELKNWPVLERETVRSNPRAFVAADCDLRKLCRWQTNGSSGAPLTIWSSRQTQRAWCALGEARWRRWNGVGRADRWAMLGGKWVVHDRQSEPPFWVWNAGLRQLYMSVHHTSAHRIPGYLEALQTYRIRYLWGCTSALNALAQEVVKLGRVDMPMAVVITNAEPVFDYQRKAIGEAFQCPVRETYGMAEMVAGASECAHGRLHLWPEAGWVEVLEGDQPMRAGIAGDLVCTGLINPDMPLVRYRLGDRGVLVDSGGTCPCGRTLPELAGLEGGADQLLYAPDGRKIRRLDGVLPAGLPIREVQIIQETLDRVRVRYVPTPQFKSNEAHRMQGCLRERLGGVEVFMQPVAEIPREANGKLPALVCKLPFQQRQALESGEHTKKKDG